MGQYPSGAAALESVDDSRYFSFRRSFDLARRPDGRLSLDAVRVRAADGPQRHRIRNRNDRTRPLEVSIPYRRGNQNRQDEM